MTYLADPDAESALTPLQAAACTYRIAFGPRAGQKVLTLQTVPNPVASSASQRCVNEQGFSLHAEVRLAINERHELEHLCRYITRPAIANERLQRNRAGQVVLQLKSPYHDGTTHIVMEPLEFMQRLAALVPRPRLHLIRFHGVLAPNAKLRPAIIPSASTEANAAAPAQPETPHHSHLGRLSWARLLKRVFDIDLEHCPNCGGPLTIIAAILDPTVIAQILAHLGLSARAPPRAPARSFDRKRYPGEKRFKPLDRFWLSNALQLLLSSRLILSSVYLDKCSAVHYILFMAQPKTVSLLGSFPVGAAEVAARLRVKPQTVHTWRHRKLMPEPRWTVSGQPAWDWAEIEAWARRTGRLRETDIHAHMLELEGIGWAGDLDELRTSRVEER